MLSWVFSSFSEQNFDAITTEAIRVRTGAVGYARFIIFRWNRRFENDMHWRGYGPEVWLAEAVFFHIIIRNNIWRVWSQNAINSKVKKLSYPREKIDDRQANTIPIPFVCKICCTRGTYHFCKQMEVGLYLPV